jgi:hypothetical protein
MCWCMQRLHITIECSPYALFGVGWWWLLRLHQKVRAATFYNTHVADSWLFVGNSPSANTRSGANRTLGAIAALGALAAPLVAASTIHAVTQNVLTFLSSPLICYCTVHELVPNRRHLASPQQEVPQQQHHLPQQQRRRSKQ